MADAVHLRSDFLCMIFFSRCFSTENSAFVCQEITYTHLEYLLAGRMQRWREAVEKVQEWHRFCGYVKP